MESEFDNESMDLAEKIFEKHKQDNEKEISEELNTTLKDVKVLCPINITPNDLETRRYYNFKEHHCGEVELVVTFCELGQVLKVRCVGCGKEENITDYTCW